MTGLPSQKAVYNDAISVGEVIRSCLNKPSIHTTKRVLLWAQERVWTSVSSSYGTLKI